MTLLCVDVVDVVDVAVSFAVLQPLSPKHRQLRRQVFGWIWTMASAEVESNMLHGLANGVSAFHCRAAVATAAFQHLSPPFTVALPAGPSGHCGLQRWPAGQGTPSCWQDDRSTDTLPSPVRLKHVNVEDLSADLGAPHIDCPPT